MLPNYPGYFHLSDINNECILLGYDAVSHNTIGICIITQKNRINMV